MSQKIYHGSDDEEEVTTGVRSRRRIEDARRRWWHYSLPVWLVWVLFSLMMGALVLAAGFYAVACQQGLHQ